MNEIDAALLIKRTKEYRELESKYESLKNKYEKDICRKRKNFFETQKKQKKRVTEDIIESMSQTDKFCKSVGLKIQNTILVPLKDCNENEKIVLSIESKEKVNDYVNKSVYIKDQKNVSNDTWQSFITFLGTELPPLNQIISKKVHLNSLIAIHENSKGVYVDVKGKLENILKNLEGDIHPKKDKIHVKFAGDTTNVSKTSKFLNITACILDEGTKALTSKGNYVIGLFKVQKENYEEIESCVAGLKEEIKNLNSLKLGDKEYKVEKYFAGDWKFLSLCLGIKAANSQQPCVWCKYVTHTTKEETLDSDCWTMIPPKDENSDKNCQKNSARTIEDAIESVESGKPEDGYFKRPIFDFIPIQRYMIDMLHLFLRISDKLYELLFVELQNEVGKTKEERKQNTRAFIKFVSETCTISNVSYSDMNKKLRLRDLSGPEKIKLFENFNLKEYVPGFESGELVNKIWKDFYSVYRSVKENDLRSADVKCRTREWLKLFLSKYSHSDISPYMHAFVFHLHEFVTLYGNINLFNLQGLEKKNDILKSQYFRGTNRHADNIKQIVLKQNRLDLLSYLDK